MEEIHFVFNGPGFNMDCFVARAQLIENDRGFSFERNCVLRRWKSKTLK